MDRSLNVATPATAAMVRAPLREQPLGLDPIDTVTESVALVTTLPPGSTTLTWTPGAIARPSLTLLGWTLKASWSRGNDGRVAVAFCPATTVVTPGTAP